ncbi:phage holin family protein [Billgrantia montanilacus]|uniref:phage holin family protein n=1 Tax=Billgrantia montanilacus TaxID=2282305 RepID=UPI0015F0AF2F|nr:phage holin family protein [Halomonas montanilacus]
MTIAELVTVIAALVIIARIITFRRNGSRYRPGVAFLAWLAVAACTWIAVRIIAAGEPEAWWLALVLAALAALVLRCRGNLAHIFSHRPRRRH